MKTIVGIKVSNRLEEVDKMQDILTNNGSIIQTRLGLHQDGGGTMNSKEGIILLELDEKHEEEASKLEKELCAIEGIDVKTMSFS